MGSIMLENIWIALKIMGQGMVGIFAAIIIIMLVIALIKKLSSGKKKNEEA